jgi:hypothetical protein
MHVQGSILFSVRLVKFLLFTYLNYFDVLAGCYWLLWDLSSIKCNKLQFGLTYHA